MKPETMMIGLNPPRGIFCWEVFSSTRNRSSYVRPSLNPPRGIFCWEAWEEETTKGSYYKVSIPHGGFFVGKSTTLRCYRWRCFMRLNPPRGIFCWEGHDMLTLLLQTPPASHW